MSALKKTAAGGLIIFGLSGLWLAAIHAKDFLSDMKKKSAPSITAEDVNRINENMIVGGVVGSMEAAIGLQWVVIGGSMLRRKKEEEPKEPSAG